MHACKLLLTLLLALQCAQSVRDPSPSPVEDLQLDFTHVFLLHL